jgi:3-oxoacyl-[acyl-carrier-protein] synthase III
VVRVGDVYIKAIGLYLPEVYSAEQAVREGLYSADDHHANELTGLPIAGDMAPFEMAVHAVEQVFERSGQNPATIDLMLYASAFHQGPDGWCAPSYVQRFAVGGSAPAIEIRHGCSGLFSSLHLAVGHLWASAEHSTVLWMGADNSTSPLMDRWSTLSPGMLVGDGASALVLSKEPGFARLLSVDSVAIPELEELHRAGEPLFPPGPVLGRKLDFKARAARWVSSAPEATEMRALLLNGHEKLVERTVQNSGRKISEMAWISHVHTSRSMLEDRLLPMYGLPLSRSSWDLVRDVGHLGVSDQVVAFERLLKAGRLAPGDLYLMAGVGPGINITTAVFEIVDVPHWAR